MLPEIAKNKVQPCALLCTLFYMPTLSPELFIKIRLQTTKLTKAGFGVFASRAFPSGGTLARFVNHAAGKACFKYFVGFSVSLALSLYLYYLGVIKKQITFSFYDLFFLLHYGFFLCVGSAAFVSFRFGSFRFGFRLAVKVRLTRIPHGIRAVLISFFYPQTVHTFFICISALRLN